MWDLDDTLILERDYVRSGFNAVAKHVSSAAGTNQVEVFDELWKGFKSGIRGNAFNRLHDQFPETRAVTIAQMVEEYRNHRPDIRIPPPALDLISQIRQQRRGQAVITDGPLSGQRSKAEAIDLPSLVDLIVFTDEWGRNYWKPHNRAFLEVQQCFNALPSECVYIGDNPTKDFIAPKALGWGTIRLLRNGQLYAESTLGTPADLNAHNWHELAEHLRLKQGSKPR